jgi:outer membrane protein
MKKIVFLVALLFAFSVQAAEIKIGYVDLRKAVTESDQGKEAMKTLENISNAKRALIDEKAREIKAINEEIAKQESILTPDAIKEKRAKVERLMREYRQMMRESEEELQKNEAEFVQKIIIDLKKILQKIAEEEGYTAILNADAVLYMPEELDITDKLIKRFNESIKEEKKTE